jgi:uncharacterized protein
MKINVGELKKKPVELDFDVSPDELHLAAEGFTFPGSVTGRVTFQMVGSRVLANGHLQTRIETSCGRCLAAVGQAIRAKVVDLTFEKRPSVAENEESHLAKAWEVESLEMDYYDEEVLDPTEPFRQLLLLKLPDYPVCRADCRGLCPTCGQDLNQGDCQCGSAGVTIGESDWKARLKGLPLK